MLEQETIDNESDVIYQESSPEVLISFEHLNYETVHSEHSATGEEESAHTDINSLILSDVDQALSSQSMPSQDNLTQNENDSLIRTVTSDTKEEVTECENVTDNDGTFEPDKTLIMGTVYELLECPVCLCHMVPPIILCECGHNVCFKCRPLMTRCPLCRGSFLNTRNVTLEILARQLGLSCNHEDCFGRCGTNAGESNIVQGDAQTIYTCPLTFYTSCYWQGGYSEIRRHFENTHPNRILLGETAATWEVKFVVKDFKMIFALNEIFFYKERLDTTLSKFFIQVFYVGDRGRHGQFSYNITISSRSGNETFTISNSVLPIQDLEHNYTYNHCAVLQYSIVSNISKYGDLKCFLTLERCGSDEQ